MSEATSARCILHSVLVDSFYMFSVTDVRDDEGMSPLDTALEELYVGDTRCGVALCMVNHGCGSDEDKAKLLCAACYFAKLDVVKELVEQHKVDPKGELSLIKCMYSY